MQVAEFQWAAKSAWHRSFGEPRTPLTTLCLIRPLQGRRMLGDALSRMKINSAKRRVLQTNNRWRQAPDDLGGGAGGGMGGGGGGRHRLSHREERPVCVSVRARKQVCGGGVGPAGDPLPVLSGERSEGGEGRQGA